MFLIPEEQENNNSPLPQSNQEESSGGKTNPPETENTPAAQGPTEEPKTDSQEPVVEQSEQETPASDAEPGFQAPLQSPPPYQPDNNPNSYPPNPYYGYQPQPKKPGKPPLSTGSKVFIGCMIGLVVLVFLGTATFITWSFLGDSLDNTAGTDNTGTSESTDDNTALPSATLDDIIALEQTEGETLSTIEVAAKIKPSVVTITVYDLASVDPLGEGSGIIISEDGYIVTNAHVIEEGNRVMITTADEETYEASVYATSTTDDLAVLKIDAKGLTPAEFGDSDKLQIGQFVMTSGNPGGSQFAGSVTLGVVSGTKRVSSNSSYTTFIQTDAAINPGNSGGPLVNMSGQVVGINSAKIADVEYEGIGFAIPSTEAQAIINDLLQYKYVKGRVKIGITIQDIDPALTVANNLPTGVTVMAVNTDSDAAKAGLAQGDIITHINSKEVSTVDELIDSVRTHTAGDKIKLSVYRLRSGVVSRFDITINLSEDKGDLS